MQKFWIFSTILLAIQSANLYAAPDKMLSVVEENSGYLSFYHPKKGTPLGEVKVGDLPHEVVISKDGKTAYVSNFGIRDYDSGSGTPGASISVVDISNRIEKYRLYTFDAKQNKDYTQIDSAPHGVKLRPPLEKQLYINVEKGGKILVFDLFNRSIIKTIEVSPKTHNLIFSEDGKTLWLMAGSDGVIRMDADTGKITGTFASKTPVRGLKYTPDYQKLMVSASNQISLIDANTLSVIKEFNNLGVGPILYSDITPNQKIIVAPAAFDHQVIVIDTETGKVLKRIVTGLNPITVLIDELGQYAYVTHGTDKHVAKINLNTFESIWIDSKDGPNGIAFAPYSPKKPHKKLVLGVALPLSGKDATHGRDMMRGYEYWRLLLMQSGGLLIQDQVYDVTIQYRDTQSDIANVERLTKELINDEHVAILLSTYGDVAHQIEKQISIENKIVLTPVSGNATTWVPNDLAMGHDYFVTTKFYDERYFKQYNFKASQDSASATALGIVLQNALLQMGSFDYESVSKLLERNQFDVFYRV